MTERLPWEIVETLPSTDGDTIARWEDRLASATDEHSHARAQIGLALSLYWAVQEGLEDDFTAVSERRDALTRAALSSAREIGDPDLVTEALLGRLLASWGPATLLTRGPLLSELTALRDRVTDEELRYRIDEWGVIDAFDHGALDDVRTRITAFRAASAETGLLLFHRRTELWRANLAMLVGEIDRSVAINQEAIAATSDTAGTPFSFQNVAITVAIERYLRRGLGDVVEAIRSILASSPRVSVNWSVGLAFALSESGAIEEARAIYGPIAADDFDAVPRDLNWLVTTQLLALIAVRIGDEHRWPVLLDQLRPFAHLDGTHGSGYASYGPVGRMVGTLAAATGRAEEAAAHFEHVLSSREPGPWTSLTRLHRALALRTIEPERASRDAERAAEELRAFGLDAWAEEGSQLAAELAPHRGRGVASLEAGTWTLRHPEGRATVPDGVGVRLLVELLARPGEALDTATLAGDAPASAAAADAASVAVQAVDRSARTAYRRRLDDLSRRRRRTVAQDEEMEYLRRELTASRFAPAASAEQERARVRVTKALGRTMASIAEQSGSLGQHLRESVETGRRCSYAPGDGRAWLVRRGGGTPAG